MRKPSEKKTHSTSIRMSQIQYDEIERNASAMNMTISQYMVHAAVHYGKTLDPETMTQIQNICNTSVEIAENADAEQVEAVKKGVQELWSRLS